MKLLATLLSLVIVFSVSAQSWQDVGGGLNNSTHCLTTWNGKVVVGGSFNNNPCNRIALWNGSTYECLAGGVGIVARAACVWQGKLVVVGDFWNNFQPCVGCNGVAVWDGTSWTPLDNGVNNDVLTCTVWNNELVIGGDFTAADGIPIARIAKWNGSTWESVGPIGSFDNDIRCMTEFQGELWVGGDFNNVNGCSPCDGVVKYDPSTGGWVGGNSGVDLVGGVNESVRVLYVNPTDGNLYMGGEFPELIDGNAGVVDYNMSGIAMYDGSDWTSLGTGLNEYCRAIHEYNGNVVAGGYFTTAGGVSANKIAKWDGTNWYAMGQGFDGAGVDEYVKAATAWNGIFFAGGAYTQAEGAPMAYIAQWYEAPVNPPTAWMNYSSTQLCGSGCIDFYDNSTNSPTSWNWTFPGSNVPTSTDENPGTVCWSSPGTYTVTLQACNSFGCNTQSIDIEVSNGATVSVNSESICTGGSATLTANPSSSGGTFLWSPGGETTQSITVSPGSTSNYSVTYTLPGCVSAPAVSTVTVVSGYNTTEDIDACQNSTVTYPDLTTEVITANTSHTSLLTSVGGCDSTVVTNVTMVTAYNQTESVSACENTSVTYPDGVTETITSSTSHTSTLSSSTGCDSIIVTNVTMTTAYNTSENVTVCENTSYTYPDGFSETITGNTSHTSAMTSSGGCDSTIVTNVTMTTAYNNTETVSACENASYTYPDGFSETITANTSHTSFMTTTGGCDSIIVTNVTMNTAYNTSENVSACNGSTYTYPDGFSETISGNTSHTSSMTSSGGCDSIIVTNVTMTTAYNMNENVSVCENTVVTYPDGFSETITANTSHTSSLTSSGGCDSTIITNVTMNAIYSMNENVTVCQNTAYTYPDGFSETITANTSHTSSLTSSGGCDSTVVTNVTMTTAYNINENVVACENSVYIYPDGFSETISGNTSHTSLLTSTSGCDSTIVTSVSMSTAYNGTENIDVCSGSTYVYPDGFSSTNITVNESHTSMLTNSNGCDSIIVTNLNVATSLNYTENVSLCSGENYTYPDGTISTNITTNENHVSTLTSQNGCDSIITTNVAVNPIPTVAVNSASICAGESIVLNATPSTGGGSYLWSPGNETTNSITVNPGSTTNYSVVYTLNGCSSSSSVGTVIVNPMPDVTTSVSNNVITAVQTGASYQWLDCNNGMSVIAGETNQDYAPVNNGSYAVTIDLSGCQDTSACDVISTIGIDELGQLNEIQIYPNPTSKTLHIDGDDLKGVNYTIIDVTGKLIKSGKLNDNTVINVSEFSTGVYFIEVKNGDLGRYRFVKL